LFMLIIAVSILHTSINCSEEMRRQKKRKTQKSSKSSKSPSKSTKEEEPYNVGDFHNLPDQPVYWEGWMKYFHYNNRTSFSKPKTFFQNNAYFHQRIPRKHMNKDDNFGLLRIPSKNHFYVVFFNNSLTFYTSRNNIMQKSYDSLKVDLIDLVPEDRPLKGGVKDLGDFNEGNCVEIKATLPRKYSSSFNPLKNFGGLGQTWILCTDSIKSKASFLSILLKRKLKSQRDHGGVITSQEIKKRKKGNKLRLRFGKKNRRVRGRPVDGYWILLQDWTRCTLKCGGGKRYQHWMCVPPKNGGKKCTGKAIRTKPCNTQKCPEVSHVLALHTKNRRNQKQKGKKGSGFQRPIVKIAAFSSRPQRYSKCILKENDAFLSDYDRTTKKTTRQPIRVVMNNQTVTLYSDEDYESKIHTFVLDTSSVLRSDFCCVQFMDSLKKHKVCGFDADCGNRINNKWSEGWIQDFKLFKYNCKTGRSLTHVKVKRSGEEDDGELFDDAKGRSKTSNEIQRQTIKFQQKLNKTIQKKVNKQKEKTMMRAVRRAQSQSAHLRLSQTQDVGFKALKKENKIENLIEHEEKERETRKLKKMAKK